MESAKSEGENDEESVDSNDANLDTIHIDVFKKINKVKQLLIFYYQYLLYFATDPFTRVRNRKYVLEKKIRI